MIPWSLVLVQNYAAQLLKTFREFSCVIKRFKNHLDSPMVELGVPVYEKNHPKNEAKEGIETFTSRVLVEPRVLCLMDFYIIKSISLRFKNCSIRGQLVGWVCKFFCHM